MRRHLTLKLHNCNSGGVGFSLLGDIFDIIVLRFNVKNDNTKNTSSFNLQLKSNVKVKVR